MYLLVLANGHFVIIYLLHLNQALTLSIHQPHSPREGCCEHVRHHLEELPLGEMHRMHAMCGRPALHGTPYVGLTWALHGWHVEREARVGEQGSQCQHGRRAVQVVPATAVHGIAPWTT